MISKDQSLVRRDRVVDRVGIVYWKRGKLCHDVIRDKESDQSRQVIEAVPKVVSLSVI